MSLILEALKKSEAQRRLGQVPTLSTEHGKRGPRGPRRWPWLLALVLLVGGGAAGYWLMINGSGFAPSPVARSEAPAQAEASAERARQQAQAAENDTREGVAGPADSGILDAIGPGEPLDLPPRPPDGYLMAPEQTVAALVTDTARMQRPADEAPRRSGSTFTPSPMPETRPPPQQSAAATMPETAEALEERNLPTPPPVQTVEVSRTVEPVAVASASLRLLHELPYRQRRDLPAMTLNLHLYNSDPERRFVIINGERKREGDLIDGNLQVVEIRRDGVHLSFHGESFLLPRAGH